MSQDEWCKKINDVLLEYTDRPIKFRNKPRPGNQWWETDITDDLEGAYALVTNMSLSAIDAIRFGIPAFTHIENIASPVSNTDISNINNPMKPNKQSILKMKFRAPAGVTDFFYICFTNIMESTNKEF